MVWYVRPHLGHLAVARLPLPSGAAHLWHVPCVGFDVSPTAAPELGGSMTPLRKLPRCDTVTQFFARPIVPGPAKRTRKQRRKGPWAQIFPLFGLMRVWEVAARELLQFRRYASSILSFYSCAGEY